MFLWSYTFHPNDLIDTSIIRAATCQHSEAGLQVHSWKIGKVLRMSHQTPIKSAVNESSNPIQNLEEQMALTGVRQGFLSDTSVRFSHVKNRDWKARRLDCNSSLLAMKILIDPHMKVDFQVEIIHS